MPDHEAVILRRELRQAGFTHKAIDAVWPSWWSSDAAESLSARTELRYTVARRLGISPRSLLDEQPRFVWQDAKYKNLGTTTAVEQALLSAFGTAAGRALLSATPLQTALPEVTAAELRSSILSSFGVVTLQGLLTTCWGLGIPVVKMAVYPLPQKRMTAMTVRVDDRYAILIGKDSKYAAEMSFYLAHELAHIFLGHVGTSPALLDVVDPLMNDERDDEETAADGYAMEVLTGQASPTVTGSIEQFNAAEAYDAILSMAPQVQIDTGVLALCLGYTTKRWKQARGALKLLPQPVDDAGQYVNRLASAQLDWESVSFGTAEYVRTLLGLT